MGKVNIEENGVKMKNSTSFNLFGEEREIVLIESFTQAGLNYEVDKKDKTCTCPAFTKSKSRRPCKHIAMVLGETREKIKGPTGSILKSSFQKAVRRSIPDIAVKNIKSMMEMDALDAVRRLLIVIPEDGLLHPRYPELCEIVKNLMRGQTLSDDEKDLVIQMTDEVARCPIRDAEYLFRGKENVVDELTFKYPRKEEEVFAAYDGLLEEEIEMLESLKLRGTLGGMKGDMLMMKAIFQIWQDRFREKTLSLSQLNEAFKGYRSELKYADVPLSESKDVMLEAVDFHCSPLLKILIKKEWIIEMLKTEYPNDILTPELRLKDLIWRKRSSNCNKFDIIQGVEVDWFNNVADKRLAQFSVDELKYTEMYDKIAQETENISKWFITKSS